MLSRQIGGGTQRVEERLPLSRWAFIKDEEHVAGKKDTYRKAFD